jgi:hypothetical protein
LTALDAPTQQLLHIQAALTQATRCSPSGITLVSWDQTFYDPVELPKGKPLVTMRDAANYIVRLPKAEQQAPEWQTAAEVLMLIGEHGLR